MKTSCAYNRCLQIFFIIVQILFIFVGCVLIGLGAWFEILDQNFEAIVDGDQLVYGAYLTIAAGCAIIVLSVIGIFGAICDYKANRVLLFVYIVLVIVVFILQSIGGILAFTYREDAGGGFSARRTQRHDARVWRGHQQRREHHRCLGLCPGELGVLWGQQLYGLGRRSQRQQLSRELLFKRPGGGRFSARWTQRHDARVWRGHQQRREHHRCLGLCPGELGVLWGQQLYGLGRRSQRQQLSRELLFKRPGGKRLF
ncbi:hypothetical protein GBAR_LOCUS16266 [Geodia barretti]|uniref:Tetraspanin n=1 Tax=Geodia barretti TaxID=519541 RepID=A0AA35SEJ7_GEOBA|nr:hypothetical protein GBAR_LOCUS16266 [Geodia barretti]